MTGELGTPGAAELSDVKTPSPHYIEKLPSSDRYQQECKLSNNSISCNSALAFKLRRLLTCAQQGTHSIEVISLTCPWVAGSIGLLNTGCTSHISLCSECLVGSKSLAFKQSVGRPGSWKHILSSPTNRSCRRTN